MSGYLVGTECYPDVDQALGAYWREMGAEFGTAQTGQPYVYVVYYSVFADVSPPVYQRVELSLAGVEYGSSYQSVPVVGLPVCDLGFYGADYLGLSGHVVGGVAWAFAFALGIGWALRGRYGH